MSLSSLMSLQLYRETAPAAADADAPEPPSEMSQPERDRAEWLACREAWRPYPSRRPTSEHVPYSLAWFEDVEKRRYARHGCWIPKLFEFNRHQGDQVLCLGEGLGTDSVQFARNGAEVSFCSPARETFVIVQRQFKLRALPGQFLRGPYHALPVASESKDVVCVAALAEPIQPLEPVIGEIFRVLKPGGKLLAALPAKYDARFCKQFWFPWRRLKLNPAEADTHFSSRRARRLFNSFSDTRVLKRHLRRSDIPQMWRWMLLPILERLMGRYLVVKAFKPLVASLALAAAA
jgi:SAM-dependent methyltransferase